MNVNKLRFFRAAATAAGRPRADVAPRWEYVNVRRRFQMIEESIDAGTQWVVFELNDEPQWARVR